MSGERAKLRDRSTDIQASNIKILLKLSKIRTAGWMLVLAVKPESWWVSLLREQDPGTKDFVGHDGTKRSWNARICVYHLL